MSSTSASVAGESPAAIPPPRASIWRRHSTALAFLAPAAVLMAVWYAYPTIDTIRRSLFSNSGNRFVWFDNYKAIFTDDVVLTAIKNNAIWVAVVPAAVTAIGLVFAVLTERVRWAVAFKIAVFMPMAVSLFAAGVIWRIMDQQEPSRGAVNALVQVFHDAVYPPGSLSDASPSVSGLTGT